MAVAVVAVWQCGMAVAGWQWGDGWNLIENRYILKCQQVLMAGWQNGSGRSGSSGSSGKVAVAVIVTVWHGSGWVAVWHGSGWGGS
jgi:hypothetical protein